MRFDDSLETVLSADMSTPFGVQTTWRQLVDLIGRRRVEAAPAAIARLAALRADVPPPVRAASGRALSFAQPPAALVAFFAEDAFNIAAPVLRSATLSTGEWLTLLPTLNPTTRSVLRHRRDLPAEVGMALESFGPVDFVLGAPATPITEAPAAAEAMPPAPIVEAAQPIAPVPQEDGDEPPAPVQLAAANDGAGTYPIADLVARIDAFHRQRAETPAAASAPGQAAAFRFESDATGLLRWIEGIAREPLVGLSLAMGGRQGAATIGGEAAAAFARRAPFAGVRLLLPGGAPAGGEWRLAATPLFDPASGRFLGYAGTARRPRAAEAAAPAPPPASDSLRQLVHELRTPANAISGFAEMIDEQLLGPVPPAYRGQAGTIRHHAAALVDAIDDLDTSARLDAGALGLGSDQVALAPLLRRAVLGPGLTRDGEARFRIGEGVDTLVAAGDRRATEMVVTRLLGVVAMESGDPAPLAIDGQREGTMVTLRFARRADRPAGELPAPVVDVPSDGPLLGAAFILALAERLAAAMRGALEIGQDRLTLRLPAGEMAGMEQAVRRA